MAINQYFNDITFGLIVLLIIGFLVYFLPSFIGFRKGHKYKWIIFAMNLILGGSGIGWLIAFIWSVWPQRSSLLDPIADPSGSGGMPKEFGERISEYKYYSQRSYKTNYCENCGKQLSETAKFCGRCGCQIQRTS